MKSPAIPPPRWETTTDRRTRSAPLPPRDAAGTLAWGLSRGDRWFLSVMLAVLAGLLTTHAQRDAVRNAAPVTVIRSTANDYVFQIDPNTATWVEWTQLDGIGPTLAKRIVEDQRQNGPFRTIDDLRRVKGIGPKTLDKLRPHLIFAEASEPAS